MNTGSVRCPARAGGGARLPTGGQTPGCSAFTQPLLRWDPDVQRGRDSLTATQLRGQLRQEQGIWLLPVLLLSLHTCALGRRPQWAGRHWGPAAAGWSTHRKGLPGFQSVWGWGQLALTMAASAGLQLSPGAVRGQRRTSPVSVSHSVSTVPVPSLPSCADSISKQPDPLYSRARSWRFCPLHAGPVQALCSPCC